MWHVILKKEKYSHIGKEGFLLLWVFAFLFHFLIHSLNVGCCFRSKSEPEETNSFPDELIITYADNAICESSVVFTSSIKYYFKAN